MNPLAPVTSIRCIAIYGLRRSEATAHYLMQIRSNYTMDTWAITLSMRVYRLRMTIGAFEERTLVTPGVVPFGVPRAITDCSTALR